MSEPLCRNTALSLRALNSLLALLLAGACQSTSAEPAAHVEPSATAAAVPSAVTAAAVTSAAPAAEATPSVGVAANQADPPEQAEAREKADPKASAKSLTTTKPASEVKSDKPVAESVKPPGEPTKPPEAPVIDKPCLATKFNFASVGNACKKGGVPQAKSLMKAWTNKAKARGETYKCATCHDNQKTYSNKPTADADLRKLLDLIKDD